MKKIMCITLAVLLMACSQATANFTGWDNFDDNSMDTGKWTNFVNEAGTSFTEINGRLEFVITNAIPDPSGSVLNWTAVEGRSYGVKWTDSLTNSFSVLTNGIVYPQNSYTDTVHSADGKGFYSINVKLEN